MDTFLVPRGRRTPQFQVPAWQVCSAGGCFALAQEVGVGAVGFAVGAEVPLEALSCPLVTQTGPSFTRIPSSWKKIGGMEAGEGCEGQGVFFDCPHSPSVGFGVSQVVSCQGCGATWPWREHLLHFLSDVSVGVCLDHWDVLCWIMVKFRAWRLP